MTSGPASRPTPPRRPRRDPRAPPRPPPPPPPPRQAAHPIGEHPHVAEPTRPGPQPQRRDHGVRREIAHAHELDLAHAKHRKPPQHERRAEPGQHEQPRSRDAQQRPLPPPRPASRHAPAPAPAPVPRRASSSGPTRVISPAPHVNTTSPAWTVSAPRSLSVARSRRATVVAPAP